MLIVKDIYITSPPTPLLEGEGGSFDLNNKSCKI